MGRLPAFCGGLSYLLVRASNGLACGSVGTFQVCGPPAAGLPLAGRRGRDMNLLYHTMKNGLDATGFPEISVETYLTACARRIIICTKPIVLEVYFRTDRTKVLLGGNTSWCG